MSWRPHLPSDDTPVYARLVAALEADIASGALEAGARLPTHRRLADDLGVGVGTITRAYAEAEARGLITARVGAGSFVSGPAPRQPMPILGEPSSAIDLGRNWPPLAAAEAALARTLPRLARRPDIGAALAYPPAAGFDAARRAGAQWLARTANWPDVPAERLICTGGAQQAIAAAVLATCRPGDALITEGATFYGVKMLAHQLGLTLVPAAMDAEGMTPNALEKAARDSGARVAYLLPLQNPTARLMSQARRRDIVAVARRLDLTLIEDDLFGAHNTSLGLPPLATLAPERCFYVTSLSKALAPGLRVGFLVTPTAGDGGRAAFDRAVDALRTVAFGPPTFGALIATDWIERGEAYDILASVNAELAARTAMAQATLGGAMEPMARPVTAHIWLPMSELAAERVAGQALRQGVEVTPPRPPFLPGVAIDGLRICLGAPADRTQLQHGLDVVRAALNPAERSAPAFV